MQFYAGSKYVLTTCFRWPMRAQYHTIWPIRGQLNILFQVTRKSCDPGEYTGWLQDGKWVSAGRNDDDDDDDDDDDEEWSNWWTLSLCRIIEEVIFKSCPTPLGKKQRAAPTDMKTNDRVEKIINDLFEFGVSIEVLFDVDDLVKAKNIPKVRIMSSSLWVFRPCYWHLD